MDIYSLIGDSICVPGVELETSMHLKFYMETPSLDLQESLVISDSTSPSNSVTLMRGGKKCIG